MMDASIVTARPTKTVDLTVHPLEAAAFAPFGQIIAPDKDGRPFGPDDAQLELNRGIPRFSIMSLKRKPLKFNFITRHMNVTQCLASVGGKPWLVGVAPPNEPDRADAVLDPDSIVAFLVPGTVAIKLHRSTWHAGPFFNADRVDFFNLELSDTNQVDHHSVRLDEKFGIEFAFAGPLARE